MPVQHRRPIPPTPPTPPKALGNKKNSKAGPVILVVLIVLAAAGYFLYPVLFKKPPEPAPVAPVKVVVDSTVVDTTLVTKIDTAIAEQPVEAPEPLSYDSSPNIPKGFYIIVGSFKSKANAKRFARRLMADVDTKVLFFEGSGLYRVSVGRYARLRDAWNDNKSIRILPGCSKSWIVENR